jgi:hypothetical protein
MNSSARTLSGFLSILLLTALALATAVAACGGGSGAAGGGGKGGSEGGAGGGEGGLGGNVLDDGGTTIIGFGDAALAPDGAIFGCTSCPSFPAPSAPTCAPTVLGPPTLVYPTDGLLLPPNMNVLEVQFLPPAGATLFEVDFENAITDVRVETTCAPVTGVRGGTSGCGVTLSQTQWNDISDANRDGDFVRVFVRATDTAASCVSVSATSSQLAFAKDDLTGGLYYWQSATYGGIGGKTGGIYFHDFGSFSPTPTPFYTSGGTGTCVGCHTLSLDGVRMSLMTDDPDGDDEFGDVHTLVMDVASRSSVGGQKMSPGFQTWTHDHAKMIATTFKGSAGGGKGPPPPPGGGGGTYDTSFDVFDGTTATFLANLALPSGMSGTQPSLSADDSSLVFVVPASGTIDKSGDTHFKLGALYVASFSAASNTLGTPAKVLGATGHNYYYPAFAPDGSFLVFDDAPDAPDTATSNGDDFYNRDARVKILHNPPAPGATPIDLPNLNVADGLTNSWPRWSPAATSFHGKAVAWVTFSSNRDYGLHLTNKGFDNCYPPEGPSYDQPQPLSKQGVTYENCAQPQIWMAGVIVDPDPTLDATDRSFPAFWLPFQDVTAHNHSAQWVAEVQAPPSGDAGTEDGGAGEGGPTSCGEPSAACSASALCCSDAVCCGQFCAYTCTAQ